MRWHPFNGKEQKTSIRVIQNHTTLTAKFRSSIVTEDFLNGIKHFWTHIFRMQTDCYICKVHFKTHTPIVKTPAIWAKKIFKIFTLTCISYSKRTVKKILNWIHIAQQGKENRSVSSMTAYQVIFSNYHLKFLKV